jgi:epoxyqueuosine reductase
MIELLKQEILKHGDNSKIVPLNRLQNIKQDIEDLKGTGFLNNFQKFIVNDLYMLELPDTDFEICSIIIVASPSPSLAKITFNWKGKRIPLMLPAGYIYKEMMPPNIEQYLNEFLGPRGYHIKHAPKLPRKLLAVRSGLGVYGRNNICYIEGMGSSLILAPYFSDIPCLEESWHDIQQMDLCKTCKACLSNCPTGAIADERFLINNERCLTYFNEAGGEWDFPEWMDPSSHNCIYGCMKCQVICPKNKEYMDNIIEPVEFTEKETLILLEGKPLEQFSEELKQKIKELEMFNYLGALPRNLKVLLDKEV